ncbi:MAG: deoxyribodipyrimidine photo-lyase [Bacteroidota bacterium]
MFTHYPAIDLSMPFALCWLRRDLRLHDHHALYQALKNHPHVLPLFIFDRDILDPLTNKKEARVHFIHEEVAALHKRLVSMGSTLLVMEGKPLAIFEQIIRKYKILGVYANEDYEPYARQRDEEANALLSSQGIPFYTCKDHVIFSPKEVMKKDRASYTVYTPYMKQWKKQYEVSMVAPFDVQRYQANFVRTRPFPLPTLQSLGFEATEIPFPSRELDTKTLQSYEQRRNSLGVDGTSHLGIHLRFGTLSIREVTKAAYEHSDIWTQQLIWRNFFIMVLRHFPHVVDRAFKPMYDRIPWSQDTQAFQAWCEGKTGFPIVDAGMRELNATGFMHNRARMITATFLTKLMLIDWRWGEAYFAEKLLDYELASNNGNWQWAAGTGCDAAPYFRIFNPMRQAERFDPTQAYVKKWVPEYGSLDYPEPILDYTLARQRALETYKKALQKR